MKYLLIFSILIMSTKIYAQDLTAVRYSDEGQVLNGLITPDVRAGQAAVLILPAWLGIDDEAKQAAVDLHAEGYAVFIADIYGEGNIPSDFSSASKIAGQYKQDFKRYQQRIQCALDAMRDAGIDGKIAVIGYCFGGTGALEVARAGFAVEGVVSIHGGLGKAADRPHIPISTKVLIEHPAEDKSVSKEDYDGVIHELNEGQADWQIITYANSGHTFTNPESAEYNKIMADRAWNHTLLFLNEVLK